MSTLGKPLIILGLAIAVIGALMVAGDRLPFRIGRLPGDIVWKGRNTTVYFPLTTIILLNLALAVIMWLLNRSRGT